jgi:hypothetical protein
LTALLFLVLPLLIAFATRVSSRQRLVPGEYKDRHDHPCGIGEDVDSSRQVEWRIYTPDRAEHWQKRDTEQCAIAHSSESRAPVFDLDLDLPSLFL